MNSRPWVVFVVGQPKLPRVARKIVLAPGLVDHDRDRVGQIEAAHASLHRDVEDVGYPGRRQHVDRKSNRLGTEKEDVSSSKTHVGVSRCAGTGKRVRPGTPDRRTPSLEIGMNLYDGPIPIIHAGPSQLRILEGKSQRFHQVESTTRVGRQAHAVAGVLWNLRMQEDDVEHDQNSRSALDSTSRRPS